MCESVKARMEELGRQYPFKYRGKPLRIIGDVVSKQYLSIDWLERRDVIEPGTRGRSQSKVKFRAT